MESEKEKLIQQINSVRKEIGLEPYPAGHLEPKGLEELEKLCSSYAELKSGYKKAGFGFRKIFAIAALSMLIAAAAFSFWQLQKSTEAPPADESYNKSSAASETAQGASLEFGFSGNQTVFILAGGGAADSMKIFLDKKESNYTLVSTPADGDNAAAFVMDGFFCDNNMHEISIHAGNISKTADFNNSCVFAEASEVKP